MRWVSGALAVMLSACATAPSLTSFPALPPSELSCVSGTDDVAWVRTAPPAHQPTLDAWCASIGPPWRHTAAARTASANRLVVVSWNMNVGRGNLSHLLTYLDAELKAEMKGEPFGLVLLLQEVHRTGAAVPSSSRFPGTTPKVLRPPASAMDIVQLAETHGLSGLYVPSMRNGTGQDRGNAILSTEAIGGPTAIELPFGKQRRVAVGAAVAGIRFISIHLDTSRSRVMQAEALARSVTSAAQATVVGGDLNAVEGQNDGSVKALTAHLPEQSCGDRRTHAWPWRLELFFGGWVGRLDHVFTNLPGDRWSKRCSTIPHLFGSDHRPILLVLSRS